MVAQSINRFGSQMFIYAALLGIASMNNMTPVFQCTDTLLLQDAFGNLTAIDNVSNVTTPPGSVHIEEIGFFQYDSRFERVHAEQNNDVSIGTYLRSWKYFQKIASRVRSAYTFRRIHCDGANKFLSDASAEIRLTHWSKQL